MPPTLASRDSLRRRATSAFKTVLAAALSIGLLLLLYCQVEPKQLLLAIRQASWPVLLLAFSVGGLLSAVSGWRYSHFPRAIGISPSPPFATALRSYFLAASFNLLLPSKLGDLGKGLICARLDRRAYPLELQLFTLYEKVSDLFALLLLGALITQLSPWLNSGPAIPALADGSVFADLDRLVLLLVLVLLPVLVPHRPTGWLSRLLRPLPRKLKEAGLFASRFSWPSFVAFQAVSLGLWCLHLLQMLLFAQCLGMNLWSVSGALALIAAVIVGLLPISFAGIGARDGALLLLLTPLYGQAQPLLLGVLLTSRYVLPAMVGLPLLRHLSDPPPK